METTVEPSEADLAVGFEGERLVLPREEEQLCLVAENHFEAVEK